MPEIVNDNDAQYAFDIVKTICTEVGPGLPGTPQERARAEIIKKELEPTWVKGMSSLKNSPLRHEPFRVRCALVRFSRLSLLC